MSLTYIKQKWLNFSDNLSTLLGLKNRFGLGRSYMSGSLGCLCKEEEEASKGIETLRAVEDQHGGVIVSMEESMDSSVFAFLLEESISKWRQQVQNVKLAIPIHSSSVD